MWGNYFGFICEDDYFGSASFDYSENWFKPGILRRIDDEVGITPNQIYDCLTSDVKSHEKLKNKLISKYGLSTNITQRFSRYGFKFFSLVVLVLLANSCKRADDAWNELNVLNSTSDTIVLNFSKLYIDTTGAFFNIAPYETFRFARSLHASDYGLIRENWGDERDTIEIYRNDTLMVKWGGPLRNLPESTHSFYNENSWEITSGGRENKYTIATFTITEDDFKKED